MGKSRFPASSSLAKDATSHHTGYQCVGLLCCPLLYTPGKYLLCCQQPPASSRRDPSGSLPRCSHRLWGDNNQEGDKERVTFPLWRDCWDLLEGIQLVNEHSRVESGLELVINYHNTSKSEHIMLKSTSVLGMDFGEESLPIKPTLKWRGAAGNQQASRMMWIPERCTTPGVNITTGPHP